MTTIEVPLERRAVLLNGLGVIFLASILFGLMAVFVRVAAYEMPPFQIAFVRFTGSLLVLLAFGRGRALRPQPGNLYRILQRGLLGAGAIILYYQGIRGAGAGLATLLNCTYPVFTALFATTLMGERFDGHVALAIVLSMIGVVVIINPAAALSPSATWGGLSALAAAVFAGGAVATARQLRITESALLITTYFMAVGAALTAPSLLLGAPTLSPGLLVALAGVVLTSVGGQVLLHQGLGFAPAIQGSLAATISVATAAAAEAFWLGEHLSRQSMLGAVIMLLAVGLAASHR
ncbi:MAG: DMT family transporter [Candidatus Binatia bacterium]